MRKRSSQKSKKGGAASAADYGTYVWGTNQIANPAGGNVIQVANHPLTPAKTGGGGSSANNALMMSMLEPQIPKTVLSESAPVSVTGGRTRRRKNKRRRMSKRKYIRK